MKKKNISNLLIVALIIFISLGTVFLYVHGYGIPTSDNLVQAKIEETEKNLKAHVEVLAGVIGERHQQQPESLNTAISYIEHVFANHGYGINREIFDGKYFNISAKLNGKETGRKIIIGAHYDTVWLSPGADDNASGIAVLLELSNLLADQHLNRSIKFIAFANEEQPFAETDLMGSRHYAVNAIQNQEKIDFMISLEMMGYYSSAKGSQNYPKPLNWFYPDTGNFIAMVSNIPSATVLMRALRAYRAENLYPVQGLMMSEKLVPDIRRSDHAQFWDQGIPALMVTDTAFYRNPNYHSVGDLPRTLDYHSMAKVTHSLANMFIQMDRNTDY